MLLQLWLHILSLCIASTSAISLTASRLDQAWSLAQSSSKLSWENGTLSVAAIEKEYQSLSVFAPTSPFPLPQPVPSGSIPKIMNLAQVTLQNRPSANSSASDRGASLLEDGAAADPASLLMAVMIANNSVGDDQKIKGIGYGESALAEINYLLYEVPRTSSGAISHRADQAQLWSDFVFMVPPALAWAGAVLNNQTLLQIAYDQCRLYREGLRQSSGLWAHILQGQGIQDPGLWATGNAWAAYGMLRVLATIKRSTFGANMGDQQGQLQTWVTEILRSSRSYITSNGLLRNYINDNSTFEDSAGSALMAAAAFRASTLNLTSDFVPMGITLLSAVSNQVNSTGYLGQVTDPYSFAKQGAMSPEGQSFVVLAYEAYFRWDAAGKQGANGGDLGKDSGGSRVHTGAHLASVAILVAVASLAIW